MSSSNVGRLGAPGALLATVAWITSGILDILTTTFTLVEGVLLAVALLGTLGGLGGLHARQAKRYGRLGATGFLAAVTGSALLLVYLVLSLLDEVIVMELTSAYLIAVILLATFIGYMLLGIATLRTKLFPRWCGFLLIICLPFAFVLQNSGGALALGLAWFGVSYALLQEDDL